MRGRCHKCGVEQELIAIPQRRTLHALPQLRTPFEIVGPFSCADSGREVSAKFQFVPNDKRVVRNGTPQGQSAAEQRMGHIWVFDRRAAMVLN